MSKKGNEKLLDKKAVNDFMDRWMNDPSFGKLLQADPKTALESCGIEANEERVNYFKALDYSLPVEELQARVSKASNWN